MNTRLAIVAVTAALAVALAACEKEGPAERAGKEIDQAVEKAGDKVEEAKEKAREALEDARK